MTDLILIDRSDPAVAVVTLNRPESRNALTLAMWQGLAETFESLSEEPEVRAVILTGAGGAFCAGADIKEFETVRSDLENGELYGHTVERANRAILECTKATYAAVSGPAFGGGCGLALCCDFRFADRTAVFAIPAARLGIVYGIHETRALVNAVGLETAKDILFTARRLDAEEAEASGMASGLVEDPMAAAKDHAARLRENAPLTIAGAKAVFATMGGGPDAPQRDRIRDWQRRALESEDYRNAVAAFAQKRKPEFHGR